MALVMEYCPNGNLNDFIVRNGQPGLPEGLSRKLIAEVLLALGYLHDELDVVFRDLKPENIVLDAGMHAKLTDFGLAKAEASSGMGARSFVGSMYFVAPEVTPAASRRYGPAVDIYALGLVAWVAFTGGVTSRNASEVGFRDAPLLSSCHNQRLPPESHEAMRAWLDERREVQDTAGPSPQQSPRMSSFAFAFVDTTTSTEPLRRGSASELRDHPFFTKSPLHPPLTEFSDWVALLPSVVEEEEPMSPASVCTEDSWAYGAATGE
ncbi:MKK2 [Symbiodinium pilosum]|uniref:MKK2 protein n=1 Tax=Symbiodinium pilosum TaxID=2952 RepID=A0A812SCC5_SYMPI|nr:MKK2 [Symbiodinium pilosum]